jgi:hypothetical protein
VDHVIHPPSFFWDLLCATEGITGLPDMSNFSALGLRIADAPNELGAIDLGEEAS